MRYALYIRKSSQDDGKQVQSLENQEQILREKAKTLFQKQFDHTNAVLKLLKKIFNIK